MLNSSKSNKCNPILNILVLISLLLQTRYIQSKSRFFIKIKSKFKFLVKYPIKRTPRPPKISYNWRIHHEYSILPDKCVSCKFNPVKPYQPNSTPRDAIVTYAVNTMIGAEIWIRSIRNAKCQAKVFILCDENAAKQIEVQHNEQLFTACGLVIAIFGNLPQIPNERGWEGFYMYRQAIRYDFLYRHKELFDRVILCDLFDTIFQGDPFTTEIKTDQIYLTKENNAWGKVYNDKSNSARILGISIFKRVKNNSIINGGTLIGGYMPILSLIEALCSNFDPQDLLSFYADDQEYINSIYYANYIQLPYKMNLLNNDEGYANVCWWPRTKLNFRLGRFAFTNWSIPPLIIHQYDKNTIYFDVNRSCPHFYNEKLINYIANNRMR